MQSIRCFGDSEGWIMHSKLLLFSKYITSNYRPRFIRLMEMLIEDGYVEMRTGCKNQKTPMQSPKPIGAEYRLTTKGFNLLNEFDDVARKYMGSYHEKRIALIRSNNEDDLDIFNISKYKI